MVKNRNQWNAISLLVAEEPFLLSDRHSNRVVWLDLPR